MLTPEYLLFFQLGDGDVVYVDRDGEVHEPFSRDPHLLGDQTTSLCMPNAWKEMSVAFLPRWREAVRLILLATDGFSNSFSQRSGFLQAAKDFYRLARKHGLTHVASQLEDWLNEITCHGSGDDVSLCLAYCDERKLNR